MPPSLDPAVQKVLQRGVVIPAHPLALTAARKLDRRRQRALSRYYVASGAGGLAVGVHTTQFAIRAPEHALYGPVLELAAEEMDNADADRTQPLVRIAGVVGPTRQAVTEAETAHDLGYHAVLLSLAALADATNDDNIITDLLTPYQLDAGGRRITRRIVGGLLGHWAVWTGKAVGILEKCHAAVASGGPVPAELLRLSAQVTDCNAAVFDAAHGFAGVIIALAGNPHPANLAVSGKNRPCLSFCSAGRFKLLRLTGHPDGSKHPSTSILVYQPHLEQVQCLGDRIRVSRIHVVPGEKQAESPSSTVDDQRAAVATQTERLVADRLDLDLLVKFEDAPVVLDL